MAGFLLPQKDANLQLNLEILLGNFIPSIIPFSSALRKRNFEVSQITSIYIKCVKRFCSVQNLPELLHFCLADHLIASADPLALTNRACGRLTTMRQTDQRAHYPLVTAFCNNTVAQLL